MTRVLAAVVLLALLVSAGCSVARAESERGSQATTSKDSAIFEWKKAQHTDVDTSGKKLFPNHGTMTKASIVRRAIIQNLDTTGNLCVFGLVAAGDCTSGHGFDCDQSGADDGVLVQPGAGWTFKYSAKFQLCGIGDEADVNVETWVSDYPG